LEKIITYYFTPVSPWSYLGHKRLMDMADTYGAKVNFKPCNILEVFEKTGGLPAGKRPIQRQKYRMAELKRWKKHLGVDLIFQPKFFPVPDELATRLILACDENMQATLTHALMTATWAQDRDISNEDTLLSICSENRLEGEALLKRAKSEEITMTLAANTKEAIEADVFGAPSYVYQDEIFWGQDRLDFLERALSD